MESVYEAFENGWINITDRFKDLKPSIPGFERSLLLKEANILLKRLTEGLVIRGFSRDDERNFGVGEFNEEIDEFIEKRR